MNRKLTKLKAAYNRNFKKLLKSKGTLAQNKYVKIERELNRQEVKLQNNGGIKARSIKPLALCLILS